MPVQKYKPQYTPRELDQRIAAIKDRNHKAMESAQETVRRSRRAVERAQALTQQIQDGRRKRVRTA